MLTPALLLALSAAPAPAAPAAASSAELDAVKAALAPLAGKEALTATAAVTRWERAGDGKKNKEGSAGATFFLAVGKSGVSVTANQGVVTAKPADDKTPNVLGTIVGGVDLRRAVELLDVTPKLGKLLEGASLVASSDTQRDGVKVRQLTVKVAPEHVSEGDAEFANERTLILWVDDAHVPVAADLVENASGGVLMIKVSSREHTEVKFQRAGDHLLVAEETVESSSSVVGNKIQSKQTTKVALASP